MTAIKPAWDLIGHEGSFRLVGGRTVYEAVLFIDNGRSAKVRLARLVSEPDGLRQINRYVDPETPVEVLNDFDEDESA